MLPKALWNIKNNKECIIDTEYFLLYNQMLTHSF